MGVGPFVEKTVPQTPASRLARSIDMPLLVIVVALVVFGLVMLYSASWDFSRAAFDDPMYMFNRQVMWLGIGIVAAVALAFLDYHHWRRLIVPAMAFTIALATPSTVLVVKNRTWRCPDETEPLVSNSNTTVNAPLVMENVC